MIAVFLSFSMPSKGIQASWEPSICVIQIHRLENERKAKESHISTMEAALEKSKEESTSLGHQLGKKY